MGILRINYLVFCLLLMGMVFTGCRSKQRLVYSTTPAEEKNNNELFTDIIDQGSRFSTFSARLNMSVTSGTRSLSSRANIRLVKNNALQVSVQPLFGVEMFRFYIDPDSMVLLDRMNKRYVKESIDSLKTLYPVGFDFYTVQALFCNALFLSGKGDVSPADYSRFAYTRTLERNYYLTNRDVESGIEYSFTVNGNDRVVFTHLIQPNEKYSLQWGYHDFAMIDKGTFPHRMNVSIASMSRRINTELAFSDIVTDEPMQLSLHVPESYTKISVAEVLKIIVPSQ